MTSLRGKNLIKSKDSTSSSLVTRIIGLQKMMTSIQLNRVLEHRLKEQLV